MIPTYAPREAALEKLAAEYQERGYRTVVEPSRADVPKFLQGFVPDIIAYGEEDSVIVELKIGSSTATGTPLREVARRVASQPGWRFDLVIVNPDGEPLSSLEPILSLSESRERIREARKLADTGSQAAAFLLLWSTVESFLRRLAEESHLPFQRLPSTSLIKQLYSLGEVDRASYEASMALLRVRNALAHGFASNASEVDLAHLFDLAERLEARCDAHEAT